MSLFFRREQRSWIPEYPIPRNSEVGAFSTRRVNLATAEGSLQKVAVYASVKVIRDVVSELPLDFYSGSGGNATQVPPPPWLRDPAGDGYGLADWISQVAYCDALRGNVVAKIASRDRFGYPTQLPLQHPDAVDVHRESDGTTQWHFNGTEVDVEDVWHRRSFAIPGQIWGLSPIGAHALTVGLGISAEQFGAQFFLDGGHPSAIFRNKDAEEIDADLASMVKQRLRAIMAGNREPLVLGNGWEYTPIQISPGDSQFLETNNYTSSECARIFGPGMAAILGYETGGSLTYANIGQFDVYVLKYTFNPILRRLERMLYDLLPRPQFAKFNRKALLETDILTRFQAHQIALANDFETVNEVRALEDMPPVDWGDTPQESKTPVQMTAPPAAAQGAKT